MKNGNHNNNRINGPTPPKRNRAFSLQMPTMSNGTLLGGAAGVMVNSAPVGGGDKSPMTDPPSSISRHSSLEALEKTDEFNNNNSHKMNANLLSRKCDDTKKAWRKLSVDSILYWGKEALPFVSPSFSLNKSLLKRSPSTKKIKRSRLVQKNGDCNVSHVSVPRKERQFLRDFFTTLIDFRWAYLLLIFASVFVVSWTFFAGIYYSICYFHEDFREHNQKNSTWEPCVALVNDFVSVFLFSVESQHTIGYGKRYTTTRCGAAIFTLCAQSICGLLIQSFMAGLVFAKMARPKKRAETLIFSKNACISLRDGMLCFLFRCGDMRNTHLVQAHIRLQLIKKRITEEGELLPLQQYDMDVGFNRGLDRIFLVWPITICHVIDMDSPLYEYSCANLACAQFEIIVLLEGIVESTGMTAQARTSYLPSEICWGHRFEKLVTYQKQNGDYQIDYSRFHKTLKVNSPLCSAKDLDLMRSAGHDICSAYYEQSHDDGADSEGPTPSSSRNPSVDANYADLHKSCSATVSLLDESNHQHHANFLLNTRHARSFLSPMVARSKRLLFHSGSRERDADDTRHLGAYFQQQQQSQPPEIVVVSPSSPTLLSPNPSTIGRSSSSIMNGRLSPANTSNSSGRASPASGQHEIL
uniref:G protein-activated inward rectifier potassium channel 3 n=1 Tax=Romanomermis culicivorax TaxID=13658 RepID=A0A915JJ31_ROMCU